MHKKSYLSSNVNFSCKLVIQIKLTGETNGTNITNVNEFPMTKAGGTIVNLNGWRQHQFRSCLWIRQKYPLSIVNAFLFAPKPN